MFEKVGWRERLRRKVVAWLFPGAACIGHRPEVIGVQHRDLPVNGEKVPHTLVLTRCNGCSQASGYSLCGTWTLEQVKGVPSSREQVESLLAVSRAPVK